MSRFIGGLFALVALATAASAQTYQIRLRIDPDEGKSAAVASYSKQEIDSRVKDAAGKEVQKRQVTQIRDEEYTVTVDEKAAGTKGPLKFTRTYTKAEAGDGKKTAKLPHSGRKIVFNYHGTRYIADPADGRELEAAVLSALAREASGSVLDTVLPVLPGKAVKEGEKWPIPAAALPKMTQGAPVDPKKSKGSAQLVKVYSKGGRQFGVLEFEAELTLTFKQAGSSGKILIKGSADAVIDGSDTEGKYVAEVTITGQNAVEMDGQKLTVGGTTKGTIRTTVGPRK